MLSIGRMTAGAGYEYLTREVATARHDYYAGGGETAGRWWGGGLARLGLAGEVTTEQMAALYGEAVDPRTGDPLGRRFPVFRTLDQRVADAVEAWTAEHGTPPQGDALVALRGPATFYTGPSPGSHILTGVLGWSQRTGTEALSRRRASLVARVCVRRSGEDP